MIIIITLMIIVIIIVIITIIIIIIITIIIIIKLVIIITIITVIILVSYSLQFNIKWTLIIYNRCSTVRMSMINHGISCILMTLYIVLLHCTWHIN